MMRALWTSASGMMAQQFNMDVISNNMTNVNTAGFKKARAEFQDLLYEHIRLAGSVDSLGQQIPVGLEVGHGARPSATYKVFSQGETRITDNPTDLTIMGDGFFQVQLPDGTIAYTRDGSFKLDGEGSIVTADGYYLEPAITIPPEAVQIVVREGGQVEVTLPQGQGNEVVGQLMIAKVINPAGFTSIGNNLYKATDATGEVVLGTPNSDGFGAIEQGVLESSNVKVVQEMVDLIVTQRAYEVNTKAIQASDDMLQQANNLKR